MLNAFYISSVGLQAQKEQLDTVASNMANLNTAAYKRQSLDFSAVLDRAVPTSADTLPSSMAEARSSRLQRLDFTQGQVHATGRPLDVAISGPGFVSVELGEGLTGYSRLGSLKLNDDGELVLAGGQRLKADVRVPSDATSLGIAADGSVSALLAGDRTPTVLGRIEVAVFTNPEALDYRGEGVYVMREGALDPALVRPGEEGAGQLTAGSLEASNVRMVDEMVALVLMQRVYELNSRVVQVADELMGMSNNLRRN